MLAATAIASHSSCAYRLTVSSAPAAAVVELPRGRGSVVTPAEVVFRYVPFQRQTIRVTAQGHRPIEIDLREREIRAWRYVTDVVFRPATLAGRSRGEVRVVLVPEHGPAGTWTEADVP